MPANRAPSCNRSFCPGKVAPARAQLYTGGQQKREQGGKRTWERGAEKRPERRVIILQVQLFTLSLDRLRFWKVNKIKYKVIKDAFTSGGNRRFRARPSSAFRWNHSGTTTTTTLAGPNESVRGALVRCALVLLKYLKYKYIVACGLVARQQCVIYVSSLSTRLAHVTEEMWLRVCCVRFVREAISEEMSALE